MKEKQFETKLRKIIENQYSGWTVKFFGCAFTAAGTPDLLCCIKGYFLAIECKTDTGRLSQLQKVKIKQILSAGGLAVVAAPRDAEYIKSIIEHLYNGKIIEAYYLCTKVNEGWNVYEN